MPSRGAAYKRHATAVKLRERAALMRDLGQRGGTVFEKHRSKADRSAGFMRDGNVSHFVDVGSRPKTKDRNRYGSVKRLSRRDARQAEAANDMTAAIYTPE